MGQARQPIRVRVTFMDDVNDFVEFDASIDEDHEISYQITDHPVERGASIVDHIVAQPKVLTIEAVVTDYPLDGVQENAGLKGRMKPGTPGSPAQAHIKGLPGTVEDLAVRAYPWANELRSAGGGGSVIASSVSIGGAFAQKLREPPTVEVTPGSPGTSPSFDAVGDDDFTSSSSGWEGRAKLLHRVLCYFQRRAMLLEVRTAFETYTNMLVQSITTPRNYKFNHRTIQFYIVFREVRFADAETVDVAKLPVRSQPTVNKGPQAGKKEEEESVAHAALALFGLHEQHPNQTLATPAQTKAQVVKEIVKLAKEAKSMGGF